MKNTKLTKEHEFKLLKMCNKLFPEYEDIYLFSKDQEDNYTEKDFLSFNDDHIHWFEFCLIHLSKKLNLDSDDGPMIFSILIQNNQEHLIDYLYDIFKEHEKS